MVKILLVDDDPLIIRMYRTALNHKGFDVETAENGIEGLEKIKQTNFDLIIFDIMMPKMNGIEFLKVVKKNPKTKDIPTIALTNLAGTQDAEEVLKLGVNRYVVKSEHRPRDIVDVVEQVLGQSGKTNQG